MKNLDLIKASREKFAASMLAAVKDDKPEEFANALTQFSEELQNLIISDAKSVLESSDKNILASRNIRQLTGEETKYYESVSVAMKSKNPKQALSELEVVLPVTVIDSVFDDIKADHALLNEIDFQNTGALINILLSKSSGVSGWGELCAEITDEINGEFYSVDLTLKKLSAFIPVCNAMLDLGPTWLDRYVRTILAEALATGLEAAIVDGDGKTKPIGMTRMLSGDTGGVFPRKTAIIVTNLDPVTIGGILNTVSKTPEGKRRAVNKLLMVVNPADYFTKVYPATTIRATNGTYNNDVMPYPMTIVQSSAVPEGFAVFGLASKYFMGVGTSKGGKLEYSDEYKFLEDQRMYRIKLYGNGQALDENAFVYADISGLEPTVLQVEVIATP